MAVGLMAHGADGPTAAIADAGRATAPPKPFGDVLKNSPGEWVLVPDQSDEFDGKAIDTRKWDIDPKDWGAWSWSPENVRQQGGSLHLQMVQRTHKRGGRELYYVSGIARNRKPITYGYFEARIKGCSRYPGASPAFWMHSRGADNRYETIGGETVRYCEIDVVELQQSEFDFRTRRRFPVNRIDCNLHVLLIRDGKEYWLRPHTHPDICKTSFDAPWDPRK
ncbi:MAG: glycosyl hydrolase family protein, partial [Planctomycetota bacterium]